MIRPGLSSFGAIFSSFPLSVSVIWHHYRKIKIGSGEKQTSPAWVEVPGTHPRKLISRHDSKEALRQSPGLGEMASVLLHKLSPEP